MPRRTWMGVIALAVMLAGSLTMPPLSARASEGGEGCNPHRNNEPVKTTNPPNNRWAGWNYAPGVPVGGASVSINTYSPSVVSQAGDQSLAWSMLSDGNMYHYAQVGYAEEPNSGPGGTQRWYIFLANDGSGQGNSGAITSWNPFTGGPDIVHPALGSPHSYTTLWGYYGNSYSGLIDSHTILGPDKLPVRFNLNFNASLVEISAETSTANDQMPGDATNPLDMKSSGWVKKGTPSDPNPPWHTMSGATPIVGKHDGSDSSWYGYQVVSDNEMKVWDAACPYSQGLYATTGSAGSQVNGELVQGGNTDGLSWSARGWGGIGAPTTLTSTARLATVSMSSGTENVYATAGGVAGDIYTNYRNGMSWSGWLDVLPGAAWNVAATSTSKNTEDVFAIGSDLNVNYQHWYGTFWSGWAPNPALGTPYPGALASFSDISAVSASPGTLDVIVTALNGYAYDKTWNGSSWSGWVMVPTINMGVTQSIATVSLTPGTEELFELDYNSPYYVRWSHKVGGAWTVWQTIPLSVGRISPISVASSSPSTMGVYVTGMDGRVYYQQYLTAGDVWSGAWQPAGYPSYLTSSASLAACLSNPA